MTLDVDRLKSLRVEDKRHRYDRRDARLYALSIGFGSDPLFEPELDFVTDRPTLKCVPTMAAVFADVIMDLTIACDLERPELALHGKQQLELFAPLPDAAELRISGSIPAIFDRGAQRGAEIHMVAEGRLPGAANPLYRATYVTIARGDGGFGGPQPERGVANSRVPSGVPDNSWTFQTNPNQALVYSLNGDPNPIHTEPAVAKQVGFDVPIMHGLGTYGIACRALLATYCDYDPTRMKSFEVRFSAPVLPGDTLVVESWRVEDGVAFQAKAKQRDVLVLKNGFSWIS